MQASGFHKNAILKKLWRNKFSTYIQLFLSATSNFLSIYPVAELLSRSLRDCGGVGGFEELHG